MQEYAQGMEVAVWRGDASGGAFVRYAVPRLESQTVLDVVELGIAQAIWVLEVERFGPFIVETYDRSDEIIQPGKRH